MSSSAKWDIPVLRELSSPEDDVLRKEEQFQFQLAGDADEPGGSPDVSVVDGVAVHILVAHCPHTVAALQLICELSSSPNKG